MSDPGWSNSWWGRDPIEEAGEDPMSRSDVFWGDGPEYEPETEEEKVERMREETRASLAQLADLINRMRFTGGVQ